MSRQLKLLLGFARLALAVYIVYFFFPSVGGRMFEEITPEAGSRKFQSEQLAAKSRPGLVFISA
jgi:hypothetical protein